MDTIPAQFVEGVEKESVSKHPLNGSRSASQTLNSTVPPVKGLIAETTKSLMFTAISPDKGSLAMAVSPANGNLDIYVLDLTTKELTRLTTNENADIMLADLTGTKMSGVVGLSREQIEDALTDASTILPEGLA